MVGLPRMHRQQPDVIGKMRQQLRCAFGGKTLQALLQRQVQAVAAQVVFIDGKPAQRETGAKIWQVTARLLFVERFMGFGRRVEGVAYQQPLFRLSEVERLVAQRRPVQANRDCLLGIVMTLQYALAETGNDLIRQFPLHRRFFQQQGHQLLHAQRNTSAVVLLMQAGREQILVMLGGGGVT
ncbi:hypothetical protein D3C80_1018440 [compost metagenome]